MILAVPVNFKDKKYDSTVLFYVCPPMHTHIKAHILVLGDTEKEQKSVG